MFVAQNNSCCRITSGSLATECVHAQSCLTLCDPMDCSPPGSFVHEISQARILEWVAIFPSRGSSSPRDRTCIFCMVGRLYYWATREVSCAISMGTSWRTHSLRFSSTPARSNTLRTGSAQLGSHLHILLPSSSPHSTPEWVPTNCLLCKTHPSSDSGSFQLLVLCQLQHPKLGPPWHLPVFPASSLLPAVSSPQQPMWLLKMNPFHIIPQF